MPVRILALLIIAVFSFLLGFLAYLGTLWLVWNQTISQGDLVAVVLWGSVAYAVLAVPIYLIVIAVLRRLWQDPSMMAYLAGCVFVGIVPTAFIMWAWEGGLRSLVSPEAQLFYAFFGISGIAFAFGWYRYVHHRS
ncbi:hypothetical protein LOK74_22430 [Brevibacillus humidisoli]|uniref:hypothetical protein n=1 Tax=Brevibacillus humidisoli TaxID=2895522 RepID=UPI001E4A07F7|nr:hypothetical protein [Brevibacillus humidisoli]UFJ40717.1 hypothetical protein LOK74_22430 [Brevibacillus humidisoli]